MVITFIGHGYVGLVSAAVFADLGNTVYVIGHTPEKINNLKKSIIPIYEPGLEELVKRNVLAKRLHFTLEYSPAVVKSDVVFIAVGTPPKANGEADLSVVFDVAEKMGKNLGNYTVVVTKSTVPVGTNRKIKQIIEKVKPVGIEFDIASAPEFLREGQAISDTFHPDRVIIGTESKKAEEILVRLHKPLVVDNGKINKLLTTNIETAEMIKYAANAFLATKISFANAIAQLSEVVDADAPTVLKGIGLDRRIGMAFLNAGAGYGGSCFPKDVRALLHISRQNGYEFDLLSKVEEINRAAMLAIVKKAKKFLGEYPKGKTVAVLGLAFKPDTDDMRDAPSLVIIRELGKLNVKIKAYDPVAIDNAKRLLKDTEIKFTGSAYEAVKDADLLILLTEWNEFKELNLSEVRKLMKIPKIIDGRNIYEPEKVKELGFSYLGVGRK